MPVASKPALFEFNSEAALAPSHLFMFNEAIGTLASDAGKATTKRNGTLIGPDWASDPTHGSMLSFVRANSDRVEWANVLDCTTSCSFVAVVRIFAAQATNGCIACFADNTVDNKFFAVEYNTTDKLSSFVQNTTSDTDAITTPSVADDVWHMIAWTIQNNERKISIDGAAFQADTFAVTFAGVPNVFHLGRRADSTPSGAANMRMAACWVYPNKVLTNGELTTLWNGGNPWSQFLSFSPSILAVTPSTFREGDSVVISGQIFTPTGNTVKIDGVTQTIVSQSASSITFTAVLGFNTYGNHGVTVETSSGYVTLAHPITIDPPLGQTYFDLNILGDTPSEILTAVPALINGAQVHVSQFRNAADSPVAIDRLTILPDASIKIDSTISNPVGYEFDVRANNRDVGGWSAFSTVIIGQSTISAGTSSGVATVSSFASILSSAVGSAAGVATAEATSELDFLEPPTGRVTTEKIKPPTGLKAI